jgi:cytochrome c2
MNFFSLKRKFLLRFSTFFLLAVFQFSGVELFSQPNGEQLFKTNCTQCHSTGDNIVIGPGLKDIHKRRNEAWLIKWIRNSQEVIKSGDAYAIAIYEKYNKTLMTPFNLTDDEIKAILAYVKAEGEKAPKVAAAPATSGGEKEKGFPWIWVLSVLGLFILLQVLSGVQKNLERAVRDKESIPHPVELKGIRAFKTWIRSNKKLIAVFLLLFIVWGSVKTWYWMADIGVQQNYKPEQPIKFSHKLHAGDNQINCLYCHHTAEKSKHAGIPSANVCMNCHKAVQQGPVYGADEIKKIYASLDYDAASQKYGPNQKPIEWVRVHNLPDLAYFNHAQHVKVGKIACQTCHGPVEEMDEVFQFSKLTMGWCIDCHRTTEVSMEGNAYYTTLHEQLKKQYGDSAKITVDKIGGLECARCHY